ncbi:glycerophosphodiester phosphodiesterase [Alkalihalobacillus sp. MEB130]|uniref:glycerophosphodiester phosphodiesterase n=1 Tax=Alkalihalobacillus sp. MEB130 TaxID=2976704 RepID=UPI0028DDA9B8|nr:glycerophosphodiester phosphodiesterase [Alkalihalobacillus sp. MEB130]MDT8861612.1 glycerophosphodiester phosphodiesterase [Alkalihalobacillus sp. MEB130]
MKRNVGKKTNKKKRLGMILITFVIAWVVINFLPIQEREKKPFFENDRPMVIAHQGGEHLAPSNTLLAFEHARELGVDVLEFDIHITQDEHLVAIHDPTVDRTTDGIGRVDELSLEKIKELDAGYYFQDLEGKYRFRGQGVKIPTVEEIFETFSDMRMIIEIKDTNAAEDIPIIIDKLWTFIQAYGLEDRVLIGSFDQTIIDKFQEATNGTVATGAGKQEVIKFVAFNTLYLNGLYRPQVDAIQIPTEQSVLDLTSARLIRAANKRGLGVHYWTINDPETMRYLLEQGANGIITDRPDLLLQIMEEMVLSNHTTERE